MSTVSGNPQGIARLSAGMPEITVVPDLRSKRQLGAVLGVSSPSEPKGKLIVDGIVRLSDKALLEYQAARMELLQFLENGYPNDLHRAQDHFESCVHALHRGINFLERLRRLGYLLLNGTPLVNRPREFELLRDVTRISVREFRDFLEHTEDDIIGDVVPHGCPATLHLGWEQATINTAALNYTDVARWCIQLHEFARPLSVVTVSARSSP